MNRARSTRSRRMAMASRRTSASLSVPNRLSVAPKCDKSWGKDHPSLPFDRVRNARQSDSPLGKPLMTFVGFVLPAPSRSRSIGHTAPSVAHPPHWLALKPPSSSRPPFLFGRGRNTSYLAPLHESRRAEVRRRGHSSRRDSRLRRKQPRWVCRT